MGVRFNYPCCGGSKPQHPHPTVFGARLRRTRPPAVAGFVDITTKSPSPSDTSSSSSSSGDSDSESSRARFRPRARTPVRGLVLDCDAVRALTATVRRGRPFEVGIGAGSGAAVRPVDRRVVRPLLFGTATGTNSSSDSLPSSSDSSRGGGRAFALPLPFALARTASTCTSSITTSTNPPASSPTTSSSITSPSIANLNPALACPFVGTCTSTSTSAEDGTAACSTTA